MTAAGTRDKGLDRMPAGNPPLRWRSTVHRAELTPTLGISADESKRGFIMSIWSRLPLMAVGVSLLALAACSDEQNAAQAPQQPPVAQAPEPAPAPNRNDDALNRIGEGAGMILDGAGDLARDARQRTERLLEDAGPTLERARGYARELGVVINELTERAMREFAAGVETVERRIEESERTRQPASGDAAAVLSPSAQLRADTRAAARAGPAGVGPAYVGVWAGDAASCARIDVDPVEMMAVITPTTIRRYEAVCNFTETPLVDGSANLVAACIAEGEMEDRSISLAMPQTDRLTLDGAELVRCHLPE
ncbi:hypothetical protein EJC49_21615 [Aquibium carbonis]|uniref:Uncharacterized protein n=1 Tax=Aquibium carbonis TaxID=2495581 RepID=A0A429YR87_9HYPH|nr:hypothetical protein [Aquibium carbonis]RST83928.1 hypothetical protein EJC49_21615 [Aquibium carbonis]